MNSCAALYVTTNNIYYYGYLAKLMLCRPIYDPILTEFDTYPGHHRYYSLDELTDTLNELGLSIVRAEHVNLFPPIKYYGKKVLE
jgi:hypothetical protein